VNGQKKLVEGRSAGSQTLDVQGLKDSEGKKHLTFRDRVRLSQAFMT